MTNLKRKWDFQLLGCGSRNTKKTMWLHTLWIFWFAEKLTQKPNIIPGRYSFCDVTKLSFKKQSYLFKLVGNSHHCLVFCFMGEIMHKYSTKQYNLLDHTCLKSEVLFGYFNTNHLTASTIGLQLWCYNYATNILQIIV